MPSIAFSLETHPFSFSSKERKEGFARGGDDEDGVETSGKEGRREGEREGGMVDGREGK
jgi:hypothetical protein